MSARRTRHSPLPWLATVTGRVGVTAAPTVLLYAKGGAAWVRDQYSVTTGGTTVATADNTPSGWTVGGGVEWAFAGNWSAFAEYDYFDFGSPGVTFTHVVPPGRRKLSTRVKRGVANPRSWHS